MGSCIICGTDVGGGRVCDSHQEDVVFDFRGDSPDDLVPSRFYRGVVDGYAEFGVFVDLAPGVTGLLHRSELDRRLDSLEWEPGDDVFVQVKGVRDNGNIDLAWSIRQADREFRGVLVQDGDTEYVPGEDDDEEAAAESETADAAAHEATESETSAPPVDTSDGSTDDVADADGGAAAEPSEGDIDAAADSGADDLTDERDRVEIGALADAIGDDVRFDGEVVGVRQTGGPTVFEVRDETGVVDVAASIEPGARAYPDVEIGDVVRI